MKEDMKSNLIFYGRTLHKRKDKDLIELITERDVLREQLDIALKTLRYAEIYVNGNAIKNSLVEIENIRKEKLPWLLS